MKEVQVNFLNPRPMLCYHCGYLGHTSKKCKKISEKFCKKFFETHDEEQICTKKCKNCDGDHLSVDKRCPRIKEEIEILNVKAQHDNITYFEAKNIVKSQNPMFSRHTKTFQNLLDENRKMFVELKIEKEKNIKLTNDNNISKKAVMNLKVENHQLIKELDEARSVVLKQETIIEKQEETLRQINSESQSQIMSLADSSETNRKENVVLRSKYSELLDKYNKLEKERDTLKAGIEGKKEIQAKSTMRSKSRSKGDESQKTT